MGTKLIKSRPFAPPITDYFIIDRRLPIFQTTNIRNIDLTSQSITNKPYRLLCLKLLATRSWFVVVGNPEKGDASLVNAWSTGQGTVD